MEKSKERLEVLNRINEFEKEKKFDIDVENDLPAKPLEANEVDYLNKKLTSKINTKIANYIARKFIDKLIKNENMIIKEVLGLDNLSNLDTGFIITCNHFNPYDSFTIEKVFRMAGQDKYRKLFKVIREGNYTNFPGLYGFFFRNCDTLPLSSNKRTMIEFVKAVDTILKRGDFILIYPEQSMWWNYRKPKPLKNGAFHFAARSNVPVIPIFITMEDSEIIGEDGFPIQEYTVNIGKPIYIIYDNQVISAPNVQEAITKGECTIDGMESYEAAENLASSIRIGSLPVKLNELRSNVVSAKLGVNAIQTTVKAGVIGFVLVCLIMIAFYAVPGVIACVALAIYMLMMLLALNGFNATLTLPGLAGIILGIGMAVDANVIIYARIQEEIGAGKSTGAAIKSGFGKAASAMVTLQH